MSTYYISCDGCDNFDGLSENTAFRTINQLNKVIKGGDAALFKCGDTFYGNIKAPAGLSQENPTTFSSYGEGKKPVITQYKIMKDASWEKYGEGIWKTNLYNTDNYTGNIYDMDANAGFLLVDGEVYGYKKFEIKDLKNRWDFLSDNESGDLFINCDKNPAEASKDIRVACNIRCIFFTDNLCVKGLTFTGTGGHGIAATSRSAYVGDCDFINIGGSQLYGFFIPNTRYGNGLECWADSQDILVENCKFTGIYDVAITMQGNNAQIPWKNIHFKNNQIWNCNQSFEIWSAPVTPDIGYENCSFENNVCVNAGFGWSNDPRPDKGNAAHLLIYNVESDLCDIKVKNNYFYTSLDAPIFKNGGADMFPKEYNIKDNTFILKKGQDILHKVVEDSRREEFEKAIKNNNNVFFI